MPVTKPFYQSKTIWFNVLTIIVVLATGLGYTPNAQIAAQTSQVLLLASPVVNAILRFYTKQPIVSQS